MHATRHPSPLPPDPAVLVAGSPLPPDPSGTVAGHPVPGPGRDDGNGRESASNPVPASGPPR